MKIRKLFCLLCASVLLSMGAKAAPKVFNVEAPRWTKLAVSTSDDGVNIRKGPSTATPRLVYNESKIEDYETPLLYYGYWSATAPKGSIQAIKFTGPNAVVGEKNGWYEVQNMGPRGESNGWVSAQYCDLVTPEPIKPGSTNGATNFIWLNNDNSADGDYGMYMNFDEMNGMATFYIGRLVNGVLVAPYQLICENAIFDNSKQCTIRPDSYGNYEIIYNRSVGTDEDEIVIDLNKLPAEIIETIIDKARKAPEKVVYFYDGYYSVSDF